MEDTSNVCFTFEFRDESIETKSGRIRGHGMKIFRSFGLQNGWRFYEFVRKRALVKYQPQSEVINVMML